MNAFSKFLRGKYTVFSLILTVFSSSNCFAEDILLEKESIISKIFQTLSKPFEGYPGYWEQLDDFDITLTSIESNKEFPTEAFSLKELKGNVVILFFTTTWCPNCVKVFQDLDNLSRKLSDKKLSNVKIITVVLGMDDDDTIKNYYETNKITSLHKFKSVSPLFFNTIRAVPTCFVLNKESTPMWGFSGIANYGSLEFLNFIEDLSKEEKK